MEEYKDSDTFEIDAIVGATGDYNLGFGDCKKEGTNIFSSLDLHRITPTGEPEEDEEEDKEDEGEEPA